MEDDLVCLVETDQDKVIFDKILIRSKQSFNFDDIVEPSNIAIVEKKVPLKKTNNI